MVYSLYVGNHQFIIEINNFNWKWQPTCILKLVMNFHHNILSQNSNTIILIIVGFCDMRYFTAYNIFNTNNWQVVKLTKPSFTTTLIVTSHETNACFVFVSKACLCVASCSHGSMLTKLTECKGHKHGKNVAFKWHHKCW